jgi:hypothetical protein
MHRSIPKRNTTLFCFIRDGHWFLYRMGNTGSPVKKRQNNPFIICNAPRPATRRLPIPPITLLYASPAYFGLLSASTSTYPFTSIFPIWTLAPYGLMVIACGNTYPPGMTL